MLAAALFEFAARNWALISIATTVVLLIVVPTVILNKYVRITLNLMNDATPPLRPESRDPAPPDRESIDFSAFDGHMLRGSMLSASQDVPTKGAIIFAHEFGVDRWSYFRYGRPLQDAGYDLFAFDFRGHGESPPEVGYKPRQFPSDREQSDMVGAIAYVEDHLERQGRPREVGLFGLSRGGGAAILAAVDISTVKAIVVDGAFSTDMLLEFYLKRWAGVFAKLRFAYENHPPTFWRFLRWLVVIKAHKVFRCRFPSVRKAVKRIRATPILFIHGERDSYIPLEQGQLLYRLANEPKFLWTVPGARHNESVVQQPEEYARRIVAFFDQHLAHCASSESLDSVAMSDLAQPLSSPDRPTPTTRTKHRVR